MTNVALAIKTYPEIKENVKEIFLMGGGYKGKHDFWADVQNKSFQNENDLSICDFKGRGNIIPTAEFNFYSDPEAVYIVLHSMIPSITILPLDVDEYLPISLV